MSKKPPLTEGIVYPCDKCRGKGQFTYKAPIPVKKEKDVLPMTEEQKAKAV